jgi:lactoylglutathione lyase
LRRFVREPALEVAHRLPPAVERARPDGGKTQRGVERIGLGVCRLGIDFAHNSIVPRLAGAPEKIAVEAARQTLSSGARRNDDAIDIDETREAVAEPEIVRAVVVGVLIEGDEQSVGVADSRRREGLRDEPPEPRRVEPGELRLVVVVEPEQRRANRGALAHVGVRHANQIVVQVVLRLFAPKGGAIARPDPLCWAESKRTRVRETSMEYLHTMIRVHDLQKTIDFFKLLGFVETRRMENEKGRYTLVFLAAPHDAATAKTEHKPTVELTFNWDPETYTGGRNFGHLAYRVDDIYATCQRLMDGGVTINRPPRDGHMAFIKTPDDISIELIQGGEARAPAEPWASMANTGKW